MRKIKSEILYLLHFNEKLWKIFLSFIYFLEIYLLDFDKMKNKQARALPSFSHGPHPKQEVEKQTKLYTEKGTF